MRTRVHALRGRAKLYPTHVVFVNLLLAIPNEIELARFFFAIAILFMNFVKPRVRRFDIHDIYMLLRE